MNKSKKEAQNKLDAMHYLMKMTKTSHNKKSKQFEKKLLKLIGNK